MFDTDLFDLTGKKALVTGGGAGIGRALALTLARAGADVVVGDLDEARAAATATDIAELGRVSGHVRCDVTAPEDVRRMVAATAAQLGRLDVAVNSAGVYRRGPDEDYSLEEWDQVIRVNLTGTWLCAQAEMQQMRRQGTGQGKIINIASISGTIVNSNGSYDCSKAAVLHLTRSLAAQWGQYNINVNALSPGYVAEVFGKTRSAEERARLRALTPLGHVQRTADLAGPLLFLAAQASDYVTGQNLIVDGGHTLNTWVFPPPPNANPRVSPDEETEPYA